MSKTPNWLGADEKRRGAPFGGHWLCGREGSRSSAPKAVLQSDNVAKGQSLRDCYLACWGC